MTLVNILRRARARRRARGVTLIEILIVLAIVGLIAGGIAVAVIPKFAQAQIETSRQSAKALQQVADLWRTSHPGECPTAERLKAEKEVNSSSKTTDAWDTPFKIVCEEDETQVVSFGPDKKENSKDDIREPDNAKEK